jgi:hypothetical protein
MMRSGTELTATISATFHAKRGEITKDRSTLMVVMNISSITKEFNELTKIFGQECHAYHIEEQGENFRYHHVRMPAYQMFSYCNECRV